MENTDNFMPINRDNIQLSNENHSINQFDEIESCDENNLEYHNKFQIQDFIEAPFKRADSNIVEKITEEHINKVIDGNENDSKRDFEYAKLSKFYNLIYFTIIVAAFIFITFYMSNNNSQLYKDIIQYILTFAAGAAGGMGWKSIKNSGH